MLSSVLFFGLPLLQGRCASGLRCLVPTWAALFVQSQQPFVVGSHSAVNVCPTPALAGQVVWPLSFVPSCCSCGLSSLGVSAAEFWPLVAPYPSVVSRLGFFLWRLFRLGFEGCGSGFGSSLLFWGGLSFPCPCCFSLAFTTLLLSRSLGIS